MKVHLYGKTPAYQWQKDTHNAIGKLMFSGVAHTVVIKAARQRYGKTAFAKAELIRFSLTKPKIVSAYVSPTLGLARQMFRDISTAAKPIISYTNAMDMIIQFINGSTIFFASQQQGEGLRGKTVSGIMVVDEGSSQTDYAYYELISPWTTVHKALTLIISTPKFKMGFFYDNFCKGLSGESKYIHTFDWVENYNVPIPPEDFDKKQLMAPLRWLMEYVGTFADAVGSVFEFRECLIDKTNKSPKEVYFGLDFGTGSGQDSTVLCGYDENGEQCCLWRCNDVSPTEQVEQISAIINAFKYEEHLENHGIKRTVKHNLVKSFIAEGNSIGKVYLDMLRKKGITVEEFTTTNESKRELVEEFQIATMNGHVKLYNDPEQVLQLSAYESSVNKSTGSVSYNAPAGIHDDIVMADMLAWRAYSRKIKPMYNVR